MSTYQRVKEILVTQGIVHESDIRADAHLVEDLQYDQNDITELIRMIEQAFELRIEPDEYASFTRVKAIVGLLNGKRTGPKFSESYADYSSLD